MAATTKPKKADVVLRDTTKQYTLVEDEFTPLRFSAPGDVPEGERVVLFYIGDTAYDVPKHFPPGLGLRVIRTSRREGDAVAMVELLEEVIGPEAYEALMNHKGITQRDLADLMAAVQKLALGALDDPKDSSRTA